MTDCLTEAIAAVDYDSWVSADDGGRIPQSSSPRVIEAMLRLLDLRPGLRVMEIGTGGGYTGALLASAVGPEGHVVSLDVDTRLVQRAEKLHHKTGHRNIEVHATDGFAGWPAGAPYERIVGWATPHLLPDAWVHQMAAASLIVSPVKLAPIATANAVVRCRVVDGEPQDASLHRGSFIEMATEVVTDFATPVRYVDAVCRPADDGMPPTWLSAARLRGQPGQLAERLLRKLETAEPEPHFVDPDDEAAFTAFLLASTDSPASAGTRYGSGLGVAMRDSVAVLHDGALVSAGSDEARDMLTVLRERWVGLGKPGYDDLVATFERVGGGWSVRAVCRPPSGTAIVS